MTGKIENEAKRWLERVLECSFQDLLAIWLPYMVLCAASIVTTCTIYDPTMKLLLYAALPENCQTWLSFVICLVQEMRVLLMCIGLAVPTWQIQIIAFQYADKALHDLADSVVET